MEYRQVQRDFQEAVRADNAGDPFGNGHENVVALLTPAYIGKLEARLRPNAWMLRAVSAWRSANYRTALQSAEAGRAEPARAAGSRDDVLLRLIPALVVDSEQIAHLRKTNTTLSAAAYRSIEAAYSMALDEAGQAQQVMTARTPDDVRAYVAYQRWRLLQHWTAAINLLDPTEPGAILGATEKAKRTLGKTLEEAIRDTRDAIPREHPLRELIRTQGGQ